MKVYIVTVAEHRLTNILKVFKTYEGAQKFISGFKKHYLGLLSIFEFEVDQ